MRVKCNICGRRLEAANGAPVLCPDCGSAGAVPERPDFVRCPSCHTFMAIDAVVCIQCGFDTRTGEKVKADMPQDQPAFGALGYIIGAGVLIVLLMAFLEMGSHSDHQPPPQAPPKSNPPAVGTTMDLNQAQKLTLDFTAAVTRRTLRIPFESLRVVDQNGSVQRRYRIKGCPRVFIIYQGREYPMGGFRYG